MKNWRKSQEGAIRNKYSSESMWTKIEVSDGREGCESAGRNWREELQYLPKTKCLDNGCDELGGVVNWPGVRKEQMKTA